MIITGTGGTDFYPSAQSDVETLIVTILLLSGAFAWTYVLALFCDMTTNGNPSAHALFAHTIRAHAIRARN